MIVVVEPGSRSLATAAQIKSLAGDLGLTRLFLVGNKVQGAEDRAYVEAHTPGLPVLGFLPGSVAAQVADRAGQAAYEAVPELAEAAREIATALEAALGSP
jgi:CO dehydrogenase maturation factor